MTSPDRKEAQTEAREPTEAQMEAARAVAEHIADKHEACGCDDCLSGVQGIVAVALATAHREGMMRAAEIARDEIVEIYEDSPDIDIECNNLIRRIVSDIETNTEQRGGNGPSLPVETATEERTACLSRPDPFEKPDPSSSPATAAPGADDPSTALGAASFSGRE